MWRRSREEGWIRSRLYCTNMIDPVLLKAYQTTKFIVYTPHKEVVLAIEERNPALDDLMEGADSPSGAFITAWNPGSLRLPDAKNQARQTELITEVRKRGCVFLEGRGDGQDKGWPPEACGEAYVVDRWFPDNCERVYRMVANRMTAEDVKFLWETAIGP